MKNLLIICFLLFTIASIAQKVELVEERFAFEPDLPYNEDIVSPEDYLGYRLGEFFTLYAHSVAYFRQLAESSPRVLYNEYGQTYEDRPLINLVISSEDNIANIDAIRERHLKLCDLETPETEILEIIDHDPVFTSFSYNIHGNEASSTEAAMQVAYRMAAAQDEQTAEILDHSVIIMFICINPDGRDRYTYWYRSMAKDMPAISPRDLDHYAPWPNGRTNHYWFDLNRDWVWGIHPESRGHVAEYQKWMPQSHVDYHEQGYNANYFTVPGTTPRNKLLPYDYEAWADTFGRANAHTFDNAQISYFTKDRFDFFYPGYGSSYPSIQGAIGMLCEQGGIAGGRAIERNDGTILTLRQRVFDHYVTSIATIRKGAERRRELLEYSLRAWDPELSLTSTTAYIFPPQDAAFLSDVLNIMDMHGVEIQQADNMFTISATGFVDNRPIGIKFPAGTYIIRTDQSRHLLINSVLARNMEIEDSVMYDMATWSAPLAYNLDAYSTSAVVPDFPVIEKLPAIPHGLEGSESGYAFVMEWSQRNAPNALAALWAKGYRTRAAVESFTIEGKKYGAGSIILLKGRNLDKAEHISDDLSGIADTCLVRIEGYNSGLVEAGYELASARNLPVKAPKVAMLVEPPFDTYSSGQIYFLFDQETRLPIDRVRTSTLNQNAASVFGGLRYGGADLYDYDVLILPDGGEGLNHIFKEDELKLLENWIRAGGVVIAQESSIDFFTEKQSKLTKVILSKVPTDSSEAAKYLSYADQTEYHGKKRIPGTALLGHIDSTHPLAWGMSNRLYALRFGSDVLEPSENMSSVGYYEKDPEKLLVAGYASQENLEHLAGKTFAGTVDLGKGKVVLLADNTQYRMFWRGPSRMMQNAVMILPSF